MITSSTTYQLCDLSASLFPSLNEAKSTHKGIVLCACLLLPLHSFLCISYFSFKSLLFERSSKVLPASYLDPSIRVFIFVKLVVLVSFLNSSRGLSPVPPHSCRQHINAEANTGNILTQHLGVGVCQGTEGLAQNLQPLRWGLVMHKSEMKACSRERDQSETIANQAKVPLFEVGLGTERALHKLCGCH